MDEPNILQKRIMTFICLSAVIYGSIFASFPIRGVIVHVSYFEAIKIVDSYSIRVTDNPSGWVLIMKMKSFGHIDGIMTNLFIDNQPLPKSNYGGNSIVAGKVQTSIPDTKNGIIIDKDGAKGTIFVYVSDMNISDGSWVTLNLCIHSKYGMDYFQKFTLYKSRIYNNS